MRANPFESQLERLARTLTEQFGVSVVCQGDQAFTDGQQIVLPSLPEPMDEVLEKMVVGFLDHEMSHVAFSDFKILQEFSAKRPGHEGLLNVVEDALIEHRAMKRWPGVRANLDAMFRQVHDRVAATLQEANPFRRFCTAVYLRLSHHNDMMGLAQGTVGYEDLLDRFPGVRNTRDAAGLAEQLSNRWLQRNPQPGSSQSPADDSESQPSKDEESSEGCDQELGSGQPAPNGRTDETESVPDDTGSRPRLNSGGMQAEAPTAGESPSPTDEADDEGAQGAGNLTQVPN